ncbi:MAG: WD40 repeat domain-containing protein [Planctomycetes bacterium]|nr:WD40 repeat domain-containing protein [Planctomycetota bacterium]
MSQFLRNRWLHRALLVGTLIALGVGIYRMTPPEAMCVIDVQNRHLSWLSPDGRRLATLRIQSDVSFDEHGPLQIWDSRTGAEVGRFFEDGVNFLHPIFSRNGRYFATQVAKHDAAAKPNGIRVDGVLLANLETGKTIRLPIEKCDAVTVLIFSPREDLLLRAGLNGCDKLWVYESASGNLLNTRASLHLIHPADFSDETLTHYVRTESGRAGIELWNPRRNQPLATLDSVLGAVRSPDGRFLVARGSTSDGKPSGKSVIWNLRTRQIDAEFSLPGPTTQPTQFISPNSQWLGTFGGAAQDAHVEVRDLATGQLAGRCYLDKVHYAFFSPDGRYLVLENPDAPIVAMFELPTMRMLWKKEKTSFHLWNLFSKDSKTMFVESTDLRNIAALDCTTGARRATITSAVPNLRRTADPRYLLMYQSQVSRLEQHPLSWIPWLKGLVKDIEGDRVFVYDTDVCRERFRFWDAKMSPGLLSDDANTLVTVHDEPGDRRTLRCWDVNAPKPLRWAIGVPAGLGALVVMFAWWRRRRATRIPAGPGGAMPDTAVPAQCVST